MAMSYLHFFGSSGVCLAEHSSARLYAFAAGLPKAAVPLVLTSPETYPGKKNRISLEMVDMVRKGQSLEKVVVIGRDISVAMNW